MFRFFRLISVFFLLSGSSLGYGQSFFLKGEVVDSAEQFLQGITAVAFSLQDESLGYGALTDASGRFTIELQQPGAYRISVHSPGFQTHRDTFELTVETPNQDLGRIFLGPQIYEADSVEIEAEQTPMIIKGDTIEFNAASYATRPNATLERLLEQLPGVEIGEDGTITAEGQVVQKITIDGKEFFGNNVQLAVKNLPADFISKVQISDSKNEESEFTGVDDGQRLKSINLKLKPEKRSGYFGNASGGYGVPDHRYVGKANAFRFSSKIQLSLLGLVNNVNEAGFGWDQIKQFMGGYDNMGSVEWGGNSVRIGGAGVGLPTNWGNNDGFISTQAGGLNLNYELSKATRLTTTYFYGGANTLRQETNYRENFLADDTYLTTDTSTRTRQSDGHAFNVRLRHELDSMQEIEVQGAGSWSKEKNENSSINRSLSGTNQLLNYSLRQTDQITESLQARGSFRYRRKFQKKGRNLYLGLDGGIGDDEQEDYIRADNRFFNKDGREQEGDTLFQEQFTQGEQSNYSFFSGYNEPLGEHDYLTMSVNRSVNQQENLRDAFDLSQLNSLERSRNVELSNQFRRTLTKNRYRLGYRHDDDHLRMRVNLNAEQTRLNNQYLSADTAIDQRFFFLLPEVDFRYTFENEQRLDFEYETSIREPSLRQLQPFVDNTNPLRIYQGNAGLRPTYRHSSELEFRTYQRRNQKGYRISLEGDYYQNEITTRKTVDSLLRQISQPVNIDEAYRLNLNARLRHPIPWLRSEVSARLDAEYWRNTVFLNGVESDLDRFSESLTIEFSNRDRKILGYRISADWDWVQTLYVGNPDYDRRYLNHRYRANFDLNLGRQWIISSDLNVRIFGGDAFENAQTLPLLGAEVRHFPLNDNRLELKLSGQDLFNRNLGFSRRSTDTFLEEERVTSLARYFLFTATWQLSSVGVGEGRKKFKK